MELVYATNDAQHGTGDILLQEMKTHKSDQSLQLDNSQNKM